MIQHHLRLRQGKAGKAGAKGARGVQGDTGLEGPKGAPGDRGKTPHTVLTYETVKEPLSLWAAHQTGSVLSVVGFVIHVLVTEKLLS